MSPTCLQERNSSYYSMFHHDPLTSLSSSYGRSVPTEKASFLPLSLSERGEEPVKTTFRPSSYNLSIFFGHYTV
jgi:hypothetical protein